jgi:hypothetical protein
MRNAVFLRYISGPLAKANLAANQQKEDLN